MPNVSTKKLKISIFGLIPQQQRVIDGKNEGKIQFTFNKDKLGETNQHCRDADLIFVVTKFVSHKQLKTIQKFSGNNVVYCNGGLSTLRSMISDVIKKENVIDSTSIPKRSKEGLKKEEEQKEVVVGLYSDSIEMVLAEIGKLNIKNLRSLSYSLIESDLKSLFLMERPLVNQFDCFKDAVGLLKQSGKIVCVSGLFSLNP